MSGKTPLVVDGMLRSANGTATITLDTPMWFAWLDEEAHNSFHFAHPSGDFTARKEHKQRGQWYWVAYRQVHNKLHKTYLGKSERLTHAHLCTAAQTLAALTHPSES